MIVKTGVDIFQQRQLSFGKRIDIFLDRRADCLINLQSGFLEDVGCIFAALGDHHGRRAAVNDRLRRAAAGSGAAGVRRGNPRWFLRFCTVDRDKARISPLGPGYRVINFSTLAAQIRSLSESPPIACVQ